MDLKDFENYELNESNVLRLYKECEPSQSTKRAIKARFYSPATNLDSPEIFFDYDKLVENVNLVSFIYGQLLSVHNRDNYLLSTNGFFNYKKEKWTEDINTLYAFYYLGIASGVIPTFARTKAGQNLTNIDHLYPTYPQNDPNFIDYITIYREEKAKNAKPQGETPEKD